MDVIQWRVAGDCGEQESTLIQVAVAPQLCPSWPSQLFPPLLSSLCNSGPLPLPSSSLFPGVTGFQHSHPTPGAPESCRGTADEMLSDVDPLLPWEPQAGRGRGQSRALRVHTLSGKTGPHARELQGGDERTAYLPENTNLPVD